MTRANDNKGFGWDFVKAGGVYQYKEDSYIGIVRVIEDLSNDLSYHFVLQVLAETFNFEPALSFTISMNKGLTGTWNGASQFFAEAEYIMIPIGTPYKHVYDKEAVDKFNTFESKE